MPAEWLAEDICQITSCLRTLSFEDVPYLLDSLTLHLGLLQVCSIWPLTLPAPYLSSITFLWGGGFHVFHMRTLMISSQGQNCDAVLWVLGLQRHSCVATCNAQAAVNAVPAKSKLIQAAASSLGCVHSPRTYYVTWARYSAVRGLLYKKIRF